MSVVTATIKSNGVNISPEYELLYIDVTGEYNRITNAEICFIDGDATSQEFSISDSQVFEPGREIEIKLKYEDRAQTEKVVFKGIVVKHALQMDVRGGVITAELSDKAVKMTTSRKSAVYENMKDSEIIKKLLTETGLRAGNITDTTLKHKKTIQYYATDWDFMLSRAEANGLLVSSEGGMISAKAPALSGPARASFKFGREEIFDFDLEADAHHQYAVIESSVWDVKNQKLTVSKAKAFNLTQGNLKPAKVANDVGGKKDTLVSAVSLELSEAQAWANAKMARSRLSMLKGRFKVQGTADIALGDLIEIEGMGKRFSGKTLVTGLRHRVSSDGWVTDIQFGLSPHCFAASPHIMDTKAAGLVPGINGLQIGIIQNFEDDPEKHERVKVKVPAMGDGIIWARVATIDAGNNRGTLFWPEPGDEVILGFLNDDPRHPVILGSVHSSANKSPIKQVKKNPEKGIVSKTGIKLLIDDEKKIFSISTSDKNIITINDKDKFIEVKDANNNIIKLSADGISLDSGKDLIIKSKANVKIEASGNVQIKGSKIDVI